MQKYSEEYISRRKKWYQNCWKAIRKANYKLASERAKKGLTQFPNDLFVEFNYYSILADYALSSNTKKHRDAHRFATNGMAKCLKKTKGIKPGFVVTMKNEYYYQTKQFRKQYHLGINEYKKNKDKYDLYSAGVGGANHALVLAKSGQLMRAKTWARKSIKAWDIYFEIDSKYYNSYVHYALAWGILGDRKKMMKSLRDSARRCKKPLTYREFQEVIEDVRLING